jgi:hypothetical protein
MATGGNLGAHVYKAVLLNLYMACHFDIAPSLSK